MMDGNEQSTERSRRKPVPGRDPEDVASHAWSWLADAEAIWRRTEDGSLEELQAIQTMSMAALTALFAEQAAQRR